MLRLNRLLANHDLPRIIFTTLTDCCETYEHELSARAAPQVVQFPDQQ